MAILRNERVQLADLLDGAMRDGRARERLTALHPELSEDEAYGVQDEVIRLREARGERVIGCKMGFTSEAKRQQMNLHSPIYGVLTDRMELRDSGVFYFSRAAYPPIHPKIEPEIAFGVARELKGTVSPDEALDACEWVAPAMEILDSRYTGFKYFSLPDVIADNASSSYFVLGAQKRKPREVDLSDLEMIMEEDGAVAQSGRSSEISGHPLRSLIQQVELLARRGLTLPAGSVVLAGAATQAIPLQPGRVIRLRVRGLGEVSLEVQA
jgi:2-oxo-3-hexenedioate decarboxylase